MLRRLLSNIVMLAFLLCGATIGMEALGLLFSDGGADPEQRIEAFITEIEADQDNVNVPREAGAERLWPPADHRETAGIMKDEADKASEIAPLAVRVLDVDMPATAVTTEWAPLIVVEARPEAESKPHPVTAQEPDARPDAPVVVAGRIAVAPDATAVQRTKDCGAGCRVKQTEPRRGRQAVGMERRRAPRGASRIDCPLLGWL